METFTCTSDELYDKHNYKIVFKNNKVKILDNYYDLIIEWNKSLGENCLYVEVLDKKQVKKKAKGF